LEQNFLDALTDRACRGARPCAPITRHIIYLELTALLAALFILAPVALAQDGEPEEPPPTSGVTDDEVNAVAAQLYCPVCENIPLDVCGTQACADWREEIRTMLADGRSEEEVITYFAERYGRRVLVTPDARGIDMLVWVLPPVGVVTGIVILALALRRMAPGALAAGAETEVAISYDDLDPEYVARLERELEEFSS
jgi:cytochrome c-type biogenesis protein CcmH